MTLSLEGEAQGCSTTTPLLFVWAWPDPSPIRYVGKVLWGSAVFSPAELGSKFAIQSIVFLRAFLDSSSHLQHISTCWTNVSFGHFAIAIWLPSNI